MGDRLEDAIGLIINEVSDETYKILKKVLDLNSEINYMDWNDWNDFYEDDSDSGLLQYLRDLFCEKEQKESEDK